MEGLEKTDLEAFDQPDVYETSDLPESDQSHSLSETVTDQSDSVEPITISATDAYSHFKGKTLDAENIDFTDSIARKRKTGYDVRNGEWEMLDSASKANETPLQSFNRLQFEVKELLDQVQQVKTTDESNAQVDPVALSKQIELLQKELQVLNLEEILGSDAIQEMSDPLKCLHDKLMLQIDNFKKTSSVKKAATGAPSSAPTTDAITYELYVKPQESKLEETAKIYDLEQRLKNLEAVVGQDRNKLNFLTANTDEKSIAAAVNILSSKLNMLDSAYLDQIENRLVVLHQCMQQVAEKKHQIEEVEKQNKVSELYELAQKVEGMSVSLPTIVDRLVALKDLHEQALQFSKALTQLDTTQQQILNSLQTSETLVKKAQDTFGKNIEIIEKNVSSLNSRIDALSKSS